MRVFLVVTGKLVAPCLTAIGLWAAIQFPSLYWLSFLALVPFAATLACRISAAGYCGSYLGGTIYFLAGTDWIRTVDQGIYLFGPKVWDWLLQAALLGLSWPLLYFLGCMMRRRSGLRMVITLPLIWISYEFVLRHAWAILDGNGWYMAKIAYALVNRLTLIQIADIGGVYAVSLMIAAVNGAVFDCMFLRRQAITSAAIAFLVLATFMIYGTWRLSQSSGHAGPIAWLMPTEDMPTRKPPRLDGEESPNLMVWSENVLDKPIIEKDSDFDERWLESAPSGVVAHVDDDPQAVIDELSHFSKETGATLVVGAAHLAFRKTGAYAFNSAVCVHPTRGYEGCYDKIWLVPWVEAMPYHRIGLARGQSLGLTPGDHYPVFQTSTGHYFAVGICYDIMFPELFIDYMHESPRPEFFVICSSELTDRTLRLQRETYVCAQFRAIETRRAVIRSVRNGYSGMFDSNGTSVAKGDGLDILEPCSVGHVPIDSRWSLYSWAGDWLPMTTVAIAALISFRHRRRPQSA